MFKPSGVFITHEELKEINASAYPGAVGSKLLDKYKFPAESGICLKTGEIYFDTIQTEENQS